jgi:hypothetical protein
MDIKFRFGGAGLIGTARDYTAFLQHLLACYQGREAGVLRPATARLLFEDAFPAGGSCRKDLGRMMRDMGSSPPGWQTGAEVTHSLAMCVNTADSPHGRRAGSATWGGAARTQQWIDPKSGIVVSTTSEGRADSRRSSARSSSSWTCGRLGARWTRSSTRCMARWRSAPSCSCVFVCVWNVPGLCTTVSAPALD